MASPINRVGRIESNTILPRQQRGTLLCVRLEHLPVIQLPCSDNDPETSTLGESLLEKLVSLAPVFRG